MVLRIFRRGICRPSKFRRPKYSALLNRLKGTSTDPPQDELAGSKKCQRVNSTFGTTDLNNFKRPKLHIAHSTVFAGGKDDDKDSLTLLESLRQRLATHNIRVEEPAKNEAKEEVARGAVQKKGEHQFSKDDSIQVEETFIRAISDSDNAKEDTPMQNPEPSSQHGDRRAVFYPPHLKAAHVRYTRYHQQAEQQNEAEMFDELAKKYLVAEKDEIDKRLSYDMERFGLPVNSSEAMRPPVNVIPPSEEPCEKCVPNPRESAKKEAPAQSPPHYAEASWCNDYFQPPNEFLMEIDRANKESDEEIVNRYIRDAQHNDMLPFNSFFDSYIDNELVQKGEVDDIKKLEFDKHDEILPFHILQCMEFIELDLTVRPDVESLIPELKADDTLPVHFSLQENLSDEISTSPSNAACPSGSVIDMLHGTCVDDLDITKFEYVYSRDYCDLEIYDHNKTQTNEFQAMTAAGSIKVSDTRIEEMQASEQAAAYNINTTEANIDGRDASQRINILQMNSQHKLETEEQNTDQQNPLANMIRAKIVEQIQSSDTESGRTVQIPHNRSEEVTKANLNRETVQPELFSESKMVADTAEPVDMPENTTFTQISQDTQQAFQSCNQAQAKYIDTPKQHTSLSPAFVQSSNETKTEQSSDASPTITDSAERQAVVQSSPGVPLEQFEASQISEDSTQRQPIVQIQNSAEEVKATYMTRTSEDLLQTSKESESLREEVEKDLNIEETQRPAREPEQAMVQSVPEQVKAFYTTRTSEGLPKTGKEIEDVTPEVAEKDLKEEIQRPIRETEAIAQSCVQAQTAPETEAKTTGQMEPLSTLTKTLDDALKKINLDLNLSLTELLRRVRARNRLQYYNDIRTQMINNMKTLQTKRCPPSDRPECPPPPDCIKPCPPPSKDPCTCPPPPKPKCPCPAKPKCPPAPPQCPPDPPKCPEPPVKKCPPDPPKCPPEPKQSPCPCPPPPKCPPPPPKCPCQVADLDDPITIAPPLCVMDFYETTSSYFATYVERLRHLLDTTKKGFLESYKSLYPTCSDPRLEINSLKLNRVKDFEPWTPIPSWPFPVREKDRKLQCPYHGCPHPKPGPVRPNCPELPCAGFPKRLTFSEFNLIP